MAAKKIVEMLQFDFGVAEADLDEVDEPARSAVPADVATEPPTVRVTAQPGRTARLPGLDRRSEGLRLAFAALETGRPPEPIDEVDFHSSVPDELAPGDASDSALTVSEFYDRIRIALRAEFPDEVWVTGEIRKVSVSKGHRYIELADHDPSGAAASQQGGYGQRRQQTAMLDVACWSRDWPVIAASLEAVGIELTAGLVVRIRGRVSVYDAGARLRFSMTDIDVEALVGGIAAARRKLLAALEAEGVLRANQRLAVPAVPLRIGLVTSAGSEAYRDFTGQLERSGYQFVTRFETSLVQGAEAPIQIAAAIARLQLHELDLIVLVRGGGAKGDLAAFDHEVVARAIVSSRYPVWTGIGHTGDRSVADEIAQRALVTPTAVGEAVVDVVDGFVEAMAARAVALQHVARRAVDLGVASIERSRITLLRASRHELGRAAAGVAESRARVAHGASAALSRCSTAVSRRADALASRAHSALLVGEHEIQTQKTRLDGFDPRRQMARGWSLTWREDGTILRSAAQVSEGDRLTTIVADGSVTSVATAHHENEG